MSSQSQAAFWGGIGAVAVGETVAGALKGSVRTHKFDAGLLGQASFHAGQADDVATLAASLADTRRGTLTRSSTGGSVLRGWFGTPSARTVGVLDSAAASSTIDGARQVIREGADDAARSATRLARIRTGGHVLSALGVATLVGTMIWNRPSASEEAISMATQ